MGKLLLLDIDGTLLDSEKKLPESAKQAVEEAKRNGHDVAIATGRAPFMIGELQEALDVDTFITFNGQYIVHNGEPISKTAIDPAKLTAVMEFAEKQDHPVVFMDNEQMISSIDFHPNIDESIKSLKFPHPKYEKDFHLNNPVYQALVFCEDHEEQQYHDEFGELSFVRWHRVSCDILPKGGSKAQGIHKLIKATGHSIEDTIAFGDGLNDLQMMEIAGQSVAMDNGHPATKAKATFVTDHVDDDGLAKAFRKLGLIK